MLFVNDVHTFNNTHHSNCLFHACNRPLIKHYLSVILFTSTLSLTNKITQCTAGAVIAPLSKLRLQSTQSGL